MLNCSLFLEGYSDFRDGLLPSAEMAAFQDHLDECASCARYDRVVSGGVTVFRDLPPVCVSADFQARLQHRIYSLEDERRRPHDGSGASVAVTVGIAATLAAIAWLPSFRAQPEPYQLPPVMAAAPQEQQVVPLLFRQGPLLVDRKVTLMPPAYDEESLFPRYAPLGTFPVQQTPVFTAAASRR